MMAFERKVQIHVNIMDILKDLRTLMKIHLEKQPKKLFQFLHSQRVKRTIHP